MTVSTRRATTKRHFSFKKSPIAAALPAPSHFNASGVVEKPDFVLSRPAGKAHEITMTVRAHCIGKGQWIAATTWGCTAGHLPFVGSYPSKWGHVSQTRSEAVENAIGTGLRQIDKPLVKIQSAQVVNIGSAATIFKIQG
jgi:hypothetical protein